MCTNILAETKIADAMKWNNQNQKNKDDDVSLHQIIMNEKTTETATRATHLSHLLSRLTMAVGERRLSTNLLHVLFVIKYFNFTSSWFVLHIIKWANFTLRFEFQFLLFNLSKKWVCKVYDICIISKFVWKYKSFTIFTKISYNVKVLCNYKTLEQMCIFILSTIQTY